MSDFKVPTTDMKFALHSVLDYHTHCASLPCADDVTRDVVEAILEEAAKFAENELAPLNAVGDAEGCTLQDGVVTTPQGFKQAYQRFVEAGWPSMCHRSEYGGQGLPESLGTLLSEMSGTANWAWAMYPGLSHGAMRTLDLHGTEDQKNTYLKKLVSGDWTGTMCLTESHCGTDLGMLRTKAEPRGDGSYTISGTKIFISAGEHDLAENIVHIVLARLPGAPPGTKGISLFIVPKFLTDASGEVGERNGVNCGAIEHKMGIHGNATCVLNFDGATGYLVGQENRGLNCMFTFMNAARIGTAIQGLAHAELGYQKSLAYAKERLQMRSLSGDKNPEGPADPIIVHPDVRRMLLTQKAFAEGGRMLLYYCAMLMDTEEHASDKDEKAEAETLLALLTPIAKAFLTEVGFESANLGLQCFGGHGYINEWGVEQNVRDARIAMLYEGTTGIQALDLLGRKVLMTQGESLKRFTKIIHKFCEAHDAAEFAEFVEPLAAINREWGDITLHVGMAALNDPEEVGAASVDYLMYSGYVTLAYFWCRAAVASRGDDIETGLADSKIKTARFYFQRILPRTRALVDTIKSGAGNLMAHELSEF
ncbi:MAG: acyl-CoA dehydrogenase C-terminal domain-containing protein [Cellvibrionaceae bacterium]|nr:acyl-CoA dehydrogenase C-terminal domain-containing protein [Cellvibrionaceae bacterium]